VLRKDFISLSALSFLSLWSKKLFGDYIDKPMPNSILKNYRWCNDVVRTFYFDVSPYSVNAWCELTSSLPGGIFEILDPFTGGTVGFSAAANLQDGEYSVTIAVREAVFTGDIITSLDIYFTKTSACAVEVETCCDDNEIVIRWLGREGAIKEWAFTGVKEWDIKVGDANTYKTQDLSLQYSQRKDIYTGKKITTGDITQEVVDFLDELRYSLQAWEWNGESAAPIVIVNDSFFKYTSRQKFFDVSIAYVVASEIQIQTG